MLVKLLFLIFGFGLVSGLIPKNRLVFLWSMFSVATVSYFTYRLYLVGAEPDFHLVYPWLKIPNLAINLEIVINSQNTYIVMALLLITLLTLLQNTFGSEKSKNSLNGLVLLNLLSALMLVFSNNYIQMLVSVGVCDVLIYSMINDVESKKKYIYYNFLANIGLLSIFAVVLGNNSGIELQNLSEYYKFGHHKDFVAVILLVCIFIKTGLFLFHGAYTGLRMLSLNRLNYILYSATPLLGYLILLKSESLLSISPYSYPILWIFSLLSILWGAYGAFVIDYIHQKAVYIAMMFWGFVYSFTAFGNSLNPFGFAVLLIAAFLFSQILLLINMASSKSNLVSEMGGFIKKIKFTFTISFLILAVYLGAIIDISSQNIYLGCSYIILFGLVSAHVGSQILLGTCRAEERVRAMLKNPPFMIWAPLVAMALVLGFHLGENIFYLLPILMAWSVIFIYRPFKKLDLIYEKDELQEADYLSNIYELLIITPIKIISRILWLIIDFVFIERTVISSIQNALRFMIYLFKRIHSGKIGTEILFVLIGLGIICAVWFYGGR